MNTKTAKRLRKEAMYHPKQERAYVVVNTSKVRGKQGTIELDPACSRSLYQELKKELK